MNLLFNELKKQTLELLRELRNHPYLSNLNHPLTEKKNNLRRQYIPDRDDDEYERRCFQIKELGFSMGMTQWGCFCQSKEDWEKLFDRVEKITKEEVQKIFEDKERDKKEEIINLKKQREKVERKKEIIKQAKNLIISERGTSYLYGQLEMKGLKRFSSSGQKLNHKLMWAVDFLSYKLSKECGFDKGKKSEMVLFKNASAFFNFIRDIKEGLIPSNDTFVNIQFKASEARKWLGLTSDEMSIADIVDLFRGLQRVIFEATGEKIFRDTDKKEWVETTVSDTLYSLRRDKLEVLSNRWKTKDVELTLRFGNIMSWLFISNLSCGKAGRITLPKGARHELDGYEQNVLRWIRLWKKPRKINVSDLAAIGGLRDKNIHRLAEKLNNILKKLKEKKYIKDFKVLWGKGKETQFEIFKNKES